LAAQVRHFSINNCIVEAALITIRVFFLTACPVESHAWFVDRIRFAQPAKEGEEKSMRKLVVFNHISLDGYFVDKNGDMSWAKADHQDPEWNEFVAGNASGGGVLVFGRITYELMASFWPTPFAIESMPVVGRDE
jgi:hypothetical protein